MYCTSFIAINIILSYSNFIVISTPPASLDIDASNMDIKAIAFMKSKSVIWAYYNILPTVILLLFIILSLIVSRNCVLSYGVISCLMSVCAFSESWANRWLNRKSILYDCDIFSLSYYSIIFLSTYYILYNSR